VSRRERGSRNEEMMKGGGEKRQRGKKAGGRRYDIQRVTIDLVYSGLVSGQRCNSNSRARVLQTPAKHSTLVAEAT
jgi:hypothetical protein